jgi:hypothetical protein
MVKEFYWATSLNILGATEGFLFKFLFIFIYNKNLINELEKTNSLNLKKKLIF